MEKKIAVVKSTGITQTVVKIITPTLQQNKHNHLDGKTNPEKEN
jgi:hypothetical protein